MAWITSHKLGDFINNSMSTGSSSVSAVNVSNGAVIAEIGISESSVSGALRRAREAREGWNKMQGHIRARHLYR